MRVTLASFCALLALNSCQSLYNTTSYTTVRYEQLCPAYYTLPTEVDSVLVVDCSQFVPTDEAAKHMSAQVCSYLSSALNQSSYIYALLCQQRFGYAELRDKADSLCSSYSKKAIIALRRFDYSYSTEGTEMLGEPYVNFRRYLSTCATFSIVMPDGSARDFEQRNDTLASTCIAESAADAAQQLPSLKVLCPEAAENLAHSFAHQLVPAWERVSRPILIGAPIKEFMSASEWASSNNWDNARDLWLQIYSRGNAMQKALAAYNMAVYFEHATDIEMALLWCSKSLDHFEDPSVTNADVEKNTAANLFKILVQRSDEVYLLDKQMNAEQ
ncbi:MAG: DUF6340 family protein [Marinilabiliaceae bacterium]|nr:DUF6340 family protein [Marinilabiliaceae bacterium]